MEVETSPKRFNWICCSGTPLCDMDSFSLLLYQ